MFAFSATCAQTSLGQAAAFFLWYLGNTARAVKHIELPELCVPDCSKPIGSMYAIYGNMDPINIPPMLAYIPAPWIRHGKWQLWFLIDSWWLREVGSRWSVFHQCRWEQCRKWRKRCSSGTVNERSTRPVFSTQVGKKPPKSWIYVLSSCFLGQTVLKRQVYWGFTTSFGPSHISSVFTSWMFHRLNIKTDVLMCCFCNCTSPQKAHVV